MALRAVNTPSAAPFRIASEPPQSVIEKKQSRNSHSLASHDDMRKLARQNGPVNVCQPSAEPDPYHCIDIDEDMGTRKCLVLVSEIAL